MAQACSIGLTYSHGKWVAEISIDGIPYFNDVLNDQAQATAARVYTAVTAKSVPLAHAKYIKPATRHGTAWYSAQSHEAYKAKADAVAWRLEELKIQALLGEAVCPQLFASVPCTKPEARKKLVPYKPDCKRVKRYRDDCAALAAFETPCLKLSVRVWCQHGPKCKCSA
jgi:hypothetical protein